MFILAVALGATLIFQEDIVNLITRNYVYNKVVVPKESNEYAKKYNYGFVQVTNDFYPKNKQELLNVFYTILDSGWTDFQFYCDKSYSTCLNDVEKMIEADSELSHINNYVHPYNSYNNVILNYNNLGAVNIEVVKLYTEDDITRLNSKVKSIEKEIINDNMDTKTKIKTIHDYIINNTTYYNESDKGKYSVNKALGPLFNGKAICGGYSDAMGLFLHNMNIKNYKIASKTHVWNYVDLDNSWFHLDLTWDDPVLSNGDDMLLDNFFLITTKELEAESDGYTHSYPKNAYIEAQ